MADSVSELVERLMQLPATVKERIERQIQLTLAAATGVDLSNVQRLQDENGPVADDTTHDLPAAWLLVTTGEEDALDGDDENAALGCETMRLPVTVDVHLLRRPTDMSIAAYGNAWIGLVKQALMVNAQWREDGTGDELAIDTQIVGTFGPTVEDEQRDVLVGVEAIVTYRHALAEPNQVA